MRRGETIVHAKMFASLLGVPGRPPHASLQRAAGHHFSMTEREPSLGALGV